MSIANTIAALQSLHKTIPEIKTAPLEFPGSINSAELPLVLTWPGRATTIPIVSRGQVQKMERIYSVRVFVEAAGQDTYDVPVRKGVVLLNKFLDLYFANKVLADGYTEIVSVSDGGLISGNSQQTTAALTYAGNFYKGFVLDVTVVEVMQ